VQKAPNLTNIQENSYPIPELVYFEVWLIHDLAKAHPYCGVCTNQELIKENYFFVKFQIIYLSPEFDHQQMEYQ